MKSIFGRKWTHVFATGETGYVLTDPVPPGKVLYLNSIFAYSPQRKAGDYIVIGVRDGEGDFILVAEAPLAAQYGVQANVGTYLGEGDRAFAQFPDADNGDTIAMHVMGVLMTLSDFQQGLG